MRRIALLFIFVIALLGMLIYSQPIEVQVRDFCTEALAVRGLDVRGSSATIEYFEGFWTLRGTDWSCTLHRTWWGLRVEDVTIYP